eukprot:UN20108
MFGSSFLFQSFVSGCSKSNNSPIYRFLESDCIFENWLCQ